MIITFILGLIVAILNTITAVFPTVTELPFGIDSILVTGIGGYKAMASFFPPLSTVLTAFILYLGFRLMLKFFKIIPVFGRAIHD